MSLSPTTEQKNICPHILNVRSDCTLYYYDLNICLFYLTIFSYSKSLGFWLYVNLWKQDAFRCFNNSFLGQSVCMFNVSINIEKDHSQALYNSLLTYSMFGHMHSWQCVALEFLITLVWQWVSCFTDVLICVFYC